MLEQCKENIEPNKKGILHNIQNMKDIWRPVWTQISIIACVHEHVVKRKANVRFIMVKRLLHLTEPNNSGIRLRVRLRKPDVLLETSSKYLLDYRKQKRESVCCLLREKEKSTKNKKSQ